MNIDILNDFGQHALWGGRLHPNSVFHHGHPGSVCSLAL